MFAKFSLKLAKTAITTTSKRSLQVGTTNSFRFTQSFEKKTFLTKQNKKVIRSIERISSSFEYKSKKYVEKKIFGKLNEKEESQK